MNYFGKMVGFITGFMFGGIIVGIIVGIIGHFIIDKISNKEFSGLHENGHYYKDGKCLEDIEKEI